MAVTSLISLTSVPHEGNEIGAARSSQDAPAAPFPAADRTTRRRMARALLDAVEARHPDDVGIRARVTRARTSLRLEAGGDDTPELQATITRTLAEIADLVAGRALMKGA